MISFVRSALSNARGEVSNGHRFAYPIEVGLRDGVLCLVVCKFHGGPSLWDDRAHTPAKSGEDGYAFTPIWPFPASQGQDFRRAPFPFFRREFPFFQHFRVVEFSARVFVRL